MCQDVLNHHLLTGTYTYAGPYAKYYKSLPDDIAELGSLVYHQIIHRMFLQIESQNPAYHVPGNMCDYPWYRMRCEDDILLTATAMTAELFRMDHQGFYTGRAVKHKIVVTCRYAAILMAAILKAKGIPCRCRSGFNIYANPDYGYDHWINQYWSAKESRWINLDVHAYMGQDSVGFDQFNIPDERIGWVAQIWLDVRLGKRNGQNYVIGGTDIKSFRAIILALFYEFHALMNNEISYLFRPSYVDINVNGRFENVPEHELQEIDKLCELMLNPDENFDALVDIWNTEKKFRILNSPLATF